MSIFKISSSVWSNFLLLRSFPKSRSSVSFFSYGDWALLFRLLYANFPRQKTVQQLLSNWPMSASCRKSVVSLVRNKSSSRRENKLDLKFSWLYWRKSVLLFFFAEDDICEEVVALLSNDQLQTEIFSWCMKILDAPNAEHWRWSIPFDPFWW